MIITQTSENELTVTLTPQDGRLIANALAIVCCILGQNKEGVINCVGDIKGIAGGDLNLAYRYYREAGIALAEAGIAAGWDERE